MTDDTVFEDTSPAPDGRRIEGKAAVVDFWRGWFAHNPDAQFEAEEMIVSGDRAVVHWMYRKMRNGQPWHLRGVDLFTVRNGKVDAKLAYVKRVKPAVQIRRGLKDTDKWSRLRMGWQCESRVDEGNSSKIREDSLIGQPKPLPTEFTIEVIGLVILQTAQVVDPDGGINDYHRQLLLKPPQARFVGVSVPGHFTPQAADRCLRTSLNEQPRSCLDGGSRCPRSTTPHCQAQQMVIDIDVSSHVYSATMCNNIAFVCTVQRLLFVGLDGRRFRVLSKPYAAGIFHQTE
jgi:ketosteroid isomerase-like protein